MEPKMESFNKGNSQEEKEKWSLREGQGLFVKRSSGIIEGDWRVSQISDGLAKVYKINPDNPKETITKTLKISELEKINNESNLDFTEADTFNDLYKLIKFQEGLKGGVQSYTPELLIEIIEQVRRGELEINRVTRTNNLRFAVEKLLELDK